MPSGPNINFTVTVDEMEKFQKALKELRAKQVLAGFPQDTTERENKEGERSPITNAALAYIHDTGMPEQNIPARPFMVPGVESVGVKIADAMRATGIAALDGDTETVEQGLNAVGLIAKSGIQNKINDGPFEPLAESTLKARARRGRAGAQEELDSRAAGNEPDPENARPLIDTGQLRNAVQYVLNDKRKN